MSHDLNAACRWLVGRASARRRRGDGGNDHEGLGETVPSMRRFPTRGRGWYLAAFSTPSLGILRDVLARRSRENGDYGLFRLIMGKSRRKHLGAESCRSRGFVARGNPPAGRE